ncbi:MAG: hypothetical protein ACI82A_004042 [Candidatus Azotimanducaceae bacterium]
MISVALAVAIERKIPVNNPHQNLQEHAMLATQPSVSPTTPDAGVDACCTSVSSCISPAAVARDALCDALETELLTLAAHLNAANYRFLKLLADFDAHQGWYGTGIKSFAHYLNWKIGMNTVMAREKVRVARALADLPLIDAAFAAGQVSYSMVRAMSRVATLVNEATLLQMARYTTAAQMELIVRKYQVTRRLDEPDDARAEDDKCLTWYQDETGVYDIHVRLPAEEGAVLIKALEIMTEQNYQAEQPAQQAAAAVATVATGTTPRAALPSTDNESVQHGSASVLNVDSNNVSAEAFSARLSPQNYVTDYPARRAEALLNIAEGYLAMPASVGSSLADSPTAAKWSSLGEKYQVFLHINANAASIDHTICDADVCSLDQRRFLSLNAARRIACDASVTTVLEDDDGNVMNIGRRSRTVPRAMAHALRIRDKHCVFPGCCQWQHTDAHHLQHWADGGETSLNNLVTLCRYHHGELHKGSYRIDWGDDTTLVFTNRHHQLISRACYPQFAVTRSTIEEDHQQLGLAIDEHTAECEWTGESMDLSMTVGELLVSSMGGDVADTDPCQLPLRQETRSVSGRVQMPRRAPQHDQAGSYTGQPGEGG